MTHRIGFAATCFLQHKQSWQVGPKTLCGAANHCQKQEIHAVGFTQESDDENKPVPFASLPKRHAGRCETASPSQSIPFTLHSPSHILYHPLLNVSPCVMYPPLVHFDNCGQVMGDAGRTHEVLLQRQPLAKSGVTSSGEFGSLMRFCAAAAAESTAQSEHRHDRPCRRQAPQGPHEVKNGLGVFDPSTTNSSNKGSGMRTKSRMALESLNCVAQAFQNVACAVLSSSAAPQGKALA